MLCSAFSFVPCFGFDTRRHRKIKTYDFLLQFIVMKSQVKVFHIAKIKKTSYNLNMILKLKNERCGDTYVEPNSYAKTANIVYDT
jgi:hypothetical protein